MAIDNQRDYKATREIDAKAWYSVREAVSLIREAVTAETLKDYCRKKKVTCKKIGPRRQWHIIGQSLLDLLAEWKLDGR